VPTQEVYGYIIKNAFGLGDCYSSRYTITVQMDFLDPEKQRRHAILLFVGYALIGVAIIISTIVLVYQANGYGVNSKGQVVQNGLLFFSSQPNSADIYVNGDKDSAQTNTRLSLASGQYQIQLKRPGYRTWQRAITVQGGDVQHFDYPFLFPAQLKTQNQATFQSGAGVASQSRDKRWIMVQKTPNGTVFDVYDTKDPKLPVTELALPAGLVHTPAGDQTWEALEWADDNVHALFKHTYSGGSEFVLLNREDVTQSVNLNTELASNPLKLTFIDDKYDKYDLLDATGGTLSTATLDNPQPVKLLDNVLDYSSYGSKMVLYATTQNAPSGKAEVMLFDGDSSSVIREVAADTTYLLEMASYSGTPFVALSAASENMVYVYRDPLGQLRDSSVKTPVAIRALRITNPTYVSFSPTAQYISAQGGSGGTQFGLYDIYLKHAYVYTLQAPFDAGQKHATWMDGNRLTYVSAGKQFVFDYDRRNPQTLMAASASYIPFFSADYRYVYALTGATAGGTVLTQTGLRTAQDL
jgi:hypothetical protein